jgi:hypothetical protein
MLRLFLLGIAAALTCLAQQSGSFLNRRIPLDQAKRWQKLTVLPREPVLRAASSKSSDRCAHILTYVPPKDIDKGIQTGSKGNGDVTPSRMPQLPSMPACEADIRTLAIPRTGAEATPVQPKASEGREDGGSGRD